MSRYQVDAEGALLGAVMLAPEAYWKVADVVVADDFASRDMRDLWAECARLIQRGEAADAVTLGERLPNLAQLTIDLATTTPSAANARAYAELIAKRATERRVKAAGSRIANLTGDDLLGEAQRILGACVPRMLGTVRHVADFLRGSLKGIVERAESAGDITGVATGFASLDELTGGWQRTDLIIVGARPSVGKTAFALQSALQAASEKIPVLFVSLEMSGIQLADRALSHVGHVNALHIRNPKQMQDDEWSKITVAKTKLDEYTLRVDESIGVTVEAISARTRQMNSEERLGLLVIDYLTYIQPPKAETVAEGIQHITRSLKALAKELQVPVMLLSQLNREGDDEPTLRHLRSSGAIEQDADVVVFLHRPDKTNMGLIKAIVAKQRNGPLGEFFLSAQMDKMRFYPCEHVPQVKPEGFSRMRSSSLGRVARPVAGTDT